MMKIIIGSTLKGLRKKQGFAQMEIAEHLNISRPTYDRYERGIIEIPLSKLFLLAEFYNMQAIDIFLLLRRELTRPIPKK